VPQATERIADDPIDLGDGVTGTFLFADEQFVDVSDDALRGWDGRRYVCVGFRVDHTAPWGSPRHTAVSFVNSPLHKETTPEWKVESREPVTISPAIECQAEREGQRCGFKGSAVQGKWINKEDEGE
jgi:hypothetical protein